MSSSAAANLGSKRTCPKCTLKFYDFNRPSIQCPKCKAEWDPAALSPAFLQPVEPKKAPKKAVVRTEDEEELTAGADPFESLDDLGDDDDESLESLAAKERISDDDVDE